MTLTPLFNEVVHIIKTEMTKSGGQELILFGSRATDTAREDSDYDLMILVDDTVDSGGRMQLYKNVYKRLRSEHKTIALDLIIKRQADYKRQSEDAALLSYFVKREGVCL
jgi:predicted nucleotidyltransferase